MHEFLDDPERVDVRDDLRVELRRGEDEQDADATPIVRPAPITKSSLMVSRISKNARAGDCPLIR
ncbi:MAG: hypothetical protein R3F34_12220 [Planctomycetota bacterium]